MKFKAGILLTGVLVCSVLALGRATDEEKEEDEVWRLRRLNLAHVLRYQIIPFEFNNGDTQQKTLVKLDGVSGKTWVLSKTVADAKGGFQLMWVEQK